MSQSRKFWACPVAIAVTLALAWLALGRTHSVGAAAPDCRELTVSEMSEAFGDTPSLWCKKQFSCDDGVIEAQLCVKCLLTTGPMDTRWLCCPKIDGVEVCTATGGEKCAAYTRYKGPVQQSGLYCGSCNSSAYQQDGVCNGLKDAVCTLNCP
jgi:hypothetical protein